MYRNKKAQAAMEFLMTYGWAILVVIVAIGALAYFGILNPDRFVQDRCLITPVQVKCDDYSANTGGVVLQIRNDFSDAIVINSLHITNTPSGITCALNTTDSASIASEATSTVSFGCSGSGLTSGAKLRGNFNLTFTPSGGLQKAGSGNVVATVI